MSRYNSIDDDPSCGEMSHSYLAGWNVVNCFGQFYNSKPISSESEARAMASALNAMACNKDKQPFGIVKTY